MSFNASCWCDLQSQEAHGSGETTLTVFRQLAALRSEPSMQWGDFRDLTNDDAHLLVYERSAEGFDTFLVAINLGGSGRSVNLRKKGENIPAYGFIVATTSNFASHGRADAFQLGTHVPLENVYLDADEGIVVGWHYMDMPLADA